MDLWFRFDVEQTTYRLTCLSSYLAHSDRQSLCMVANCILTLCWGGGVGGLIWLSKFQAILNDNIIKLLSTV